MSASIDIFHNIRQLRLHSRKLSLSELEGILQKLSNIIEERREQCFKLQQEQIEKQGRIDAIFEQLKDEGIEPSELLGLISTPVGRARNVKGFLRPIKYAKRPAKYHYIDNHGVKRTWTGQGRIPKVISDAIQKGMTLEQFVI
ncbi:H-NS family histone-like protein [Klebsiella variicola]|uniref:H-NS family histone-like protein n=1 Tax=Klebsiella variicola TaxID=244366 RepID=UPI0015E84C5B|nr:H-NS family nucleoid-associated regulatory protein [Klebsiella variicola]